MSFRELEIIIRTLLKTTKDLPSADSGENINSIYAALPPVSKFIKLTYNIVYTIIHGNTV